MNNKVKLHLILIGIPIVIWSISVALDRHIPKEGMAIGMLVLNIGYTIFAYVVTKNYEKRDPLRIYLLLGVFLTLLTLLIAQS